MFTVEMKIACNKRAHKQAGREARRVVAHAKH